jgi:hypothetical protein
MLLHPGISVLPPALKATTMPATAGENMVEPSVPCNENLEISRE